MENLQQNTSAKNDKFLISSFMHKSQQTKPIFQMKHDLFLHLYTIFLTNNNILRLVQLRERLAQGVSMPNRGLELMAWNLTSTLNHIP